MAKTMTVRPAREDLVVRMPERGFRMLDAAGEEVPRNGYWNNRLRDGDVVKSKVPAKKPAANKEAN